MIRKLLLALTLTAGLAQAQVSYTGGVYSQNFDTLPGATNNTLNTTWSNNSTLAGWYANKTAFSVTDGTIGGTAATFSPTAAANTNNVGLFSFGTAASTDRALGSRATAAVAGNNPVLYGVRLINSGTTTLTSFTVTFTGEQWFKTGKTTADTVLLDYQIGATGIDTGTWVNASGGTFTSLINTATAAVVAGNTAANRRGIAVKVTGVSWAPNTELWVRFQDTDNTGDEQGMAIDDFYFTAENESGVFFNGSTSYITMGQGATASALNTSSFTVECRFIRTGPGVIASTGTGGVTTALPLVAKGVGEADGTNVDANYFLGIDNATGKLVADFEQLNATNNGTAYPAGQNFPVFGSTALQNGVFYHVAATYDTATAVWKLYVNGVAETTTQTLPTFVGVVPRNDNIQGLGIGTTVNSTGARAGFFHGIIDEARIWNYARSAAEISANKDVKITAATGLLGRYGLDEATGTTAAGTNAAGTASPVGTLSGSPLPIWSNAKTFVPNIEPTVSITAPTTGSSVTFPGAVNITADATDTDGSIVKVEFFNGATKLGEDLTAPYAYSWTNAAVGGPYSLTAVATDNGGTSTTSSAVTVTVLPNPNQPPVVTVVSPTDNGTGIGSSTTLNLSIADNESDAQTVNFFGRVTTPLTPGADFTIIQVPDTQYYSENTGRNVSSTGNPAIDIGAKAAIYNSQMNWIVDNRNTRNIAFVSHMGDIAQNGDAQPNEWIVASNAQSIIENPATTLRAHGIPWGVAPGNHDQMPVADAGGVANYYGQYFGVSRWDARPYFGGRFGTKPLISGGPQFAANVNNYQLFSASGMDFVIIHLEYDARAKSFYQGVLDWADSVLKAFPNRRGIVTSHGILNTGNPGAFFTQGQNIYDDLKDNPNLFLTLCGHTQGEGRRTDVFQGNTVHSILSDYQETKNGGNGFLRILTFKPSTNQIQVESYSPWLNRAVDATDSIPSWTTTYNLSYNMQSAVTAWIPLGTVNVAAAGTTASLNWTGLEAGKDYEWYAMVNDGINTANSTARRFTTTAPAAPTVALTSPTNGGSAGLGTTVNIAATASDTDGTIARVEFFDGGIKLGEATAAPYTFAWSGATPGAHSLTAVATDNSGFDAISSVVTFTISNIAPTVVLVDPDESTLEGNAPENIYFEATASDADGTIARVEFYANSTKVGEVLTAPYTFNWIGGISGTYTLFARAVDNFGATADSAHTVSLVITNPDNAAPTIAYTIPTNGADYAVGSAIALAASGTDSDGIIAKVEFFQGTTKLGEDTTAPFTFSWSGATAGTYSLTAVAADNDGAVVTSAPVSITVSPAGVRSIVSSITETFDTMGTAGTTPPNGWSMKYYGTANVGTNSTWTDSIPIPGTGTISVASQVATTAALTVNNAPTATNINSYNAQGASTSDRVIATSPTTGAGVSIQVQLRNSSGNAVNAINIGYDIRRYLAVATANELPGYWLFYSLDNGTTWVNASALNPTVAGPTGVIVPNTVGVTTVPSSTVNLATTWANGADLLLRWVDDNAVATSPDQIVGLDNVSITAVNIIGTPPTVTLTSPTVSDSFFAAATINLAATAADADGTISKVEFYSGATKLGEDSSSPYTYTWTGVAAGTYGLTARATDNDSNVVASSVVNVTVNPAPGSGTLTRSPYLNQPNHNSIVVRWRTSQSVPGRVRYGTSSTNLDQLTDEASTQTNHEVKLTGLTPYTRYYYSVGSAYDTLTPEATDITTVRSGTYTFAAPTAEDYTFRTAPTPGTAVATRIWVVGDCGRGSATQAAGRDAYYNWMGSRVPDLNLQLGDNAYNSGTETEYQTGYWNMYPTIFRKMPQWSTLGNHDANNGNTSPTLNWPYFDMFTFPIAGECGGVASGTEHYYSWDYGNIHFICLDSQTTLANRTANAPQTVWLQNDLASTTKTWIIAFFHHPPYSKGSHDSDTEAQMVLMRDTYNPILEAGGVDLVLTGHSHNYERSVLLDGNYGNTGTITAAMKKNAGNGSTTGFTTNAGGVIRNAANGYTATATVAGAVIPPNGAYIKPLTGPRDHFGAVYNTAGMSGQADGGVLNHSAMYISYNQVGTVNLDINGNTLVASFIQSDGTAPDNYTITKAGAADSDGDGLTDEFEIANGLNRNSATDSSGDSDGDGISNLVEFAFGTNPGTSDTGKLEVSNGVITKRGQPDVSVTSTTNGVDFKAAFCRRKDQSTAGLTYTVQFSSDLSTWQSNVVTPTIVADDGTYQVVTVRYPFFVNGQKARFFRVSVTTN